MNWQKVEFLKSTNSLKDLPQTNLPEFVFVGRSNVGKSSLINALTKNNKVAKISSKPGKTRLINHFLIDSKAYFVDLPGYGYAAVSKTMKNHWNELLGDYLYSRKQIKAAILLIDSKVGLQKKDFEFIEMLEQFEINFWILLTKIDRLSNNQILNNSTKITKELKEYGISNIPIIPISSKNGKNMNKIYELVLKTLEEENVSSK